MPRCGRADPGSNPGPDTFWEAVVVVKAGIPKTPPPPDSVRVYLRSYAVYIVRTTTVRQLPHTDGSPRPDTASSDEPNTISNLTTIKIIITSIIFTTTITPPPELHELGSAFPQRAQECYKEESCFPCCS
eukprot:GHVT01028089.1.p1 GENE.GHVT01028089.1~~GHVT01028089.1.p1  ORF type:complete len:130 (-),score=0.77 GHVT01028089.1:76-465(-)